MRDAVRVGSPEGGKPRGWEKGASDGGGSGRGRLSAPGSRDVRSERAVVGGRAGDERGKGAAARSQAAPVLPRETGGSFWEGRRVAERRNDTISTIVVLGQ